MEEAKWNGKKIWQSLNNLTGRQTKQNKELELNINNQLVKNPTTLATEFNN